MRMLPGGATSARLVIRLSNARKVWGTITSIFSGFASHNHKAEAGAVTLQELKKSWKSLRWRRIKASRSGARQMGRMVSKPD
jgi:hypothetical protein